MIRFSVGLWGNTVEEMATLAAEAEGAGFEMAWAHELHRTALVPIAAAACKTTRIGLGTGIQLAFARSPMITALAALDLDELSGGRFHIGLGTGVKRLNEKWHGATFGSPAKHLKETIETVRLLAGGAHKGSPMMYDGEYYDLDVRGFQRPWPPVRDSIPIYVAAVGPVLSRLAGSHGDGWIGHELNSRQWVTDVILPNIQGGIEGSGRSRSDFNVVLTVCCAVNSDRGEAIRQAAYTVAFYATVKTYHEFFAAAGFGEESQKIGRLFREGKMEEMLSAVPEEMVQTFAVAGTPDYVRSRLRELSEYADVLNLSAPHHYVAGEAVVENIRSIIALVDGWS